MFFSYLILFRCLRSIKTDGKWRNKSCFHFHSCSAAFCGQIFLTLTDTFPGEEFSPLISSFFLVLLSSVRADLFVSFHQRGTTLYVAFVHHLSDSVNFIDATYLFLGFSFDCLPFWSTYVFHSFFKVIFLYHFCVLLFRYFVSLNVFIAGFSRVLLISIQRPTV